METIHEWKLRLDLLEELKIDCLRCCGLCCTALYCAKTDGFPSDKEAGIPCACLGPDFHCMIHGELAAKKLKGCMAFDCLGAGQKVTGSYGGADWKNSPEIAQQMFAVFLVVFQLHQMLWYLAEASAILCAEPLWGEIGLLISENKRLTQLCPDDILRADGEAYQQRVNAVLKKVGALVLLAVTGRTERDRKRDFMGKDLRKEDLRGRDFSMSLLIAANLGGGCLYGTNFLGADMRDTNIEDADLSQSIFLTQRQINSAKGSRGTALPPTLTYPVSWPE